MTTPRTITIHHSPDADDAFMAYGLVCGEVRIPGYDFRLEKADIQTLNEKALRGELEVSAASVHAAFLSSPQYSILPFGASFGGERHGPRLVVRKPFDLKDGRRRTFAIPGRLTSAALAFKIFLHENEVNAALVDMHFDRVQLAVSEGEVDAGLIIHEGQLTHEREGLASVLDLGEWWWQRTGGLPLPLGVNIVRTDLGNETISAVCSALGGSIEYGLNHRARAMEYALSFGRGISHQEADQFIDWYVNKRAIHMGDDGRHSIDRLRSDAVHVGAMQASPELLFVG